MQLLTRKAKHNIIQVVRNTVKNIKGIRKYYLLYKNIIKLYYIIYFVILVRGIIILNF